MVIVVAIVVALLTMVVPAASTMWRDRRIAEAQNTISGVFMTARARALQSGEAQREPLFITDSAGNKRTLLVGNESGLFFFLDGEGVQRIMAIEQVTLDDDPGTREAWANVFNVVPERSYSLPAPMRVVPRYAVYDEKTEPDKTRRFDPDELAHSDLFSPANADTDQAQRHRNFFTVMYSATGELIVRRDVLIRDLDADAAENRGGDLTGLEVRDDIKKYYRQDNSKGELPINPDKSIEDVDLVAESEGTALNFPSVDGLLVYDESLFAAAGDPGQKRKFLIDSAQPFYVHRISGVVIRGPIGETVAKTTP